MVVCRFFLQGNCRYGDNCWNEHPSGGNQGYSVTAQRQLFGGKKGGNGGQKVSFRDSFGQNQNPYRWISQDAQQQQQQQGRSTSTTTQQMSASDIVKGLATEVAVTWEGGHMWPFSCLGFEKDMPSLPGFVDISPEEMRFDSYEAIKSGNIQSYIEKVEGAFNLLNTQRQELKNPSMTLKQKLISFIEDCRRKKASGSGGHVSLFSDSSTGGNAFGSVSSGGLFGSSTNNQPSSGLFGQQASFGQTGSQSIFGQAETQSTFGQTGTQSLFGKGGTQSGFGQTASQESSFGQTGSLFGHGAFAQGVQPTFGQSTSVQSQTGQVNLFGQPSPFGQDQTQTQKSLFGKPADSTPLGGASFNTQQVSTGASGSVFQTSSSFGQPSEPSKNMFGQPLTVTPPDSGTHAQGHAQESQQGETSVYTPLSKLTPDELERFKAPKFSLGFIPTRPPPRELCF